MKRIDPFIVGILLAFALGLLWPAPNGRCSHRDLDGRAGDVLVAILFFLYGLRLRTSEVLAGLEPNVKVQGLIFASTYIVFPLIGLAIHPLLTPVLGEGLNGFLYLAFLPSTIQSSVTFTSIAKGDTAATVSRQRSRTSLACFHSPRSDLHEH